MIALNDDTCAELTLLTDATVVRGVLRCRKYGEQVSSGSTDRLTAQRKRVGARKGSER